MNRLLLVLVAGVCLLNTPSAGAVPIQPDQQRYTVKFSGKAEVGLVLLVKKSSQSVTKLHLTDAQGQVLKDDKVTDRKELEYETEILKVADNKVVKFSRTYTKAEIEQMGNKRTPSYKGRTVYFESKDGKMVVSVKGEPALADADKAELEREANDSEVNSDLDRALEPGKAIKIGESWTPDAKKLAAAFSKINHVVLDEDTLKASCKLLKVYTLNKKQWGSLEVTFDLPIKSADMITLESGSTISMTGVMEIPIDGSGGLGSARLKLKGKLKGDIQGIKLEAETDGTNEQTIEVKKKPEQ